MNNNNNNDDNFVNILKKTLCLRIESDFLQGNIWQIKSGWDSSLSLSLVKKYLSNEDAINFKNNTLNQINNYPDSKIIDLLIYDVISKNIFANNAFKMFNQKQTEDALFAILDNKNKNIVFTKLLFQDNIIKQNNVSDVIWLNKKLLSKILTKSNIDRNIENIDLMLNYTSDKNKIEAFKKIYSLFKDNMTEYNDNKMKDLENKYLSKIQKIMLYKVKPSIEVQKQNEKEIDDFILMSSNEKKVMIKIEIDNVMIKKMGFAGLNRYIKGMAYGTYVHNDYAKFEFQVNSTSLMGLIEYDLEKSKGNYGDILEIVLRKTIVKLLKEIEKDTKLLDFKFREMIAESITPEIIDQEFAKNREETLLKKVYIKEKEKENILRKKI